VNANEPRGGRVQAVVFPACTVTLIDGQSWTGRIETRGYLYRWWFVSDDGQAEFRADLTEGPPTVRSIERDAR
jgi:hypothetical protein